MAEGTELLLQEIASAIGDVASILGTISSTANSSGGGHNKSAEDSERNIAKLVKKALDERRGARERTAGRVFGELGFDGNVIGKMKDAGLAFGSLGVAVTAATAAFKFLSPIVNKTAEDANRYRLAINKNNAALGKQAVGNANLADASDRLEEALNKLKSNSGLSDALAMFKDAAASMVNIVNYNWAEKLNNRIFGGEAAISDIPSANEVYKEMSKAYGQETIDSALVALKTPMLQAGMTEYDSTNMAIPILYGLYEKHGTDGTKLNKKGFAESVENYARMVAGEGYDVATGVRTDADILTGYALEKGQPLPQYLSKSLSTKQSVSYLTDALTTSIGKGTKEASNFASTLKRTGELMNDINNTLFSFDEVIQLVAKEYEDVNDKVMESVDKSYTVIEGSTEYHDQTTYTIDVNPTPVTVESPTVYFSPEMHINVPEVKVTVEDLRERYGITPGSNIVYDINGDGEVTVDEYKERAGITEDKPIKDFYTAYSAYIYSGGRYIAEGFTKEEFDYFTKTQKLPDGYDENGYKLARGGLVLDRVNNATIGEAGAEAVIPLESYGGVEYLANAMNEALNLNGEELDRTTVNVTLNGQILEMNDYNVRRLGQKLAAVMENNKRRNGGV